MAADRLLLADGSNLLLSDGTSVLLLSTESAAIDAYPQTIGFAERTAISVTSPLTSTSFRESKSLTFQES